MAEGAKHTAPRSRKPAGQAPRPPPSSAGGKRPRHRHHPVLPDVQVHLLVPVGPVLEPPPGVQHDGGDEEVGEQELSGLSADPSRWVILMCGGDRHRLQALTAALTARLCNVLITDAVTAAYLLEERGP